MKTIKIYNDHLGVLSGILCMLHCAFTPFLFLSQAQLITTYSEFPFLWNSLNILFLTLSFSAVYLSSKNSSNKYVKIMMFLFWGLLTFTILNELFELYHVQEFYTYFFATTLCFLHIYNLKYCGCVDDDCCVHSTKKNS